MTQNNLSDHKGWVVKVRDTIGAGDAFTATLTHGLVQKRSLPEINEKARRLLKC